VVVSLEDAEALLLEVHGPTSTPLTVRAVRALVGRRSRRVNPSEVQIQVRVVEDNGRGVLALGGAVDGAPLTFEQRDRLTTAVMRAIDDDEGDYGHLDPLDRPPRIRPLRNFLIEDDELPEQSGFGQDLPPDERRQLAETTAATINHTLAMLFLRLGPPPDDIARDTRPVTSGGGGAHQ
jgi:hypothetical protein